MSSSTRSCRTQLTAHCCGAVANASMPTSHARSRRSSPIRSQRRLRPSHVITLRPGWPIRRRAIGWRRANSRSRARPMRDRYVDAGLALIPRLPQGSDRQSLELALYVARATALSPLKAYTAPETVAAFEAAKRLLDAGVGNDSQRFLVLSGLYMTPYIAARLE